MKNLLHHLFFPHEKNNHRSKLLHHTSLIIITVAFLSLSFLTELLKTSTPSILGISYSITVSEILNLTNKKREEKGIQEVKLNEKLSKAAYDKAQDMFSKDYWAHFSPDGTTPWYFIKQSGYSYVYAGENLAKGFTNSSEVVNAWMNSVTHRENLLSDKYSDIGFAVVEGKLLGEDTVLVVQMFGSEESFLARENTNKVNNNQQLIPTPTIGSEQKVLAKNPSVRSQFSSIGNNPLNQAAINNPIFDLFTGSKNISLIILSFILIALIIDLIIIERKKIPRLVGHNADHILLFILFILYVVFSRRGSIF